MSISLLLLAVLEQHSRGENERNVDTDDAKCAREDRVQEGVGEGRKGADAADVRGSRESRRACGVWDEGRGSAVSVAAAVELFLVSILFLSLLFGLMVFEGEEIVLFAAKDFGCWLVTRSKCSRGSFASSASRTRL